MAPTTTTDRKKKASGVEPTRRSTRTITPRTIFNAGVTKPKPAPKKRKTTVSDKVVSAAKKTKGTVARKPAVKATSTKKTKGSDSKVAKKAKTRA